MKLDIFQHEFEGKTLYWLGNILDSSKPTTIFIHGFPDNAYVWEKTAEAFLGQINLICPFMWGTYGEEIIHTNEYKHSLFAKSIHSLLQELKLDQSALYIVAHDMGGPVAGELNRLINVKKNIFINTYTARQFIAKLKNISQVVKSSYMIPLQFQWLHRFLFDPSRRRKKILNFIYKIGQAGSIDSYLINNSFGYRGGEIYRQILRDYNILNKERLFPIIYVWGRKEKFLLPPSKSELERFSSTPILIYLNSGHWPQLSNTSDLTRLLEQEIINHV